MGKRAVDQHGIMNRGWEHAEELADVARDLLRSGIAPNGGVHTSVKRAHAALRRYEEARKL